MRYEAAIFLAKLLLLILLINEFYTIQKKNIVFKRNTRRTTFSSYLGVMSLNLRFGIPMLCLVFKLNDK